MVATASADGDCDASPKGDPAGELVHVIDERTIALAERPGNRRADGYRNMLENPHVGLLFVIPGRGDTLRVNGRARLVSEAPFFDEMVVKGHRPVLAMVVEIDELFHHCAKAFLRSALWDPDTWDPEARVPRRAVLAQKLERPESTVAELDEYYGPSYAEKHLRVRTGADRIPQRDRVLLRQGPRHGERLRAGARRQRPARADGRARWRGCATAGRASAATA